MSNISLGSGVRQNLFSLQQTSDLISLTQNRLATGKKVNSAIDNPTNFFTAQGLNGRAADLNEKLDGISNSLKTVEAADKGIKAITALVKNAQSIVSQARKTPVAADRAEFITQYNEIRSQISSLAKDSGFNGVNLLAGDNVEVVFNEQTGTGAAKLTITGQNFGTDPTAGPVIGISIAAAGNFGVEDDPLTTTANESEVAFNAVDAELKGALDDLRTTATTFGSQLAIVQTRKDFTSELINTLKAGADNLVNANSNEEAANLLTLQTRQQLSSQALALASQQEQSVLRLLG